jgi:ABC-type antimicrobial peptide transport system permease subunit
MRKNVFIKSMRRQRIRSAVLMLLVAAAAFAFVMRCVEYFVVTDQIEGLGGYYRSIGYLQSTESAVSAGAFPNALPAAEIIRSSPYVDFDDSQRNPQGFLQGLQNADIIGMNPRSAMNIRITDAFFYGELLSMRRISFLKPPHIESILLEIKVDSVLLGYPEHVQAGQELLLRFIIGDDAQSAALETALEDMRVGERYLLRGAYNAWPFVAVPWEKITELTMKPVNESTRDYTRQLTGAPVWYIPAQPGEYVDTDSPDYEWLTQELEWLRYNQSAISLLSTADMTASPRLIGKSDFKITEGRWLNHEDQLNANPVAVIHEQLAWFRGLKLGDTLVVNLPPEQTRIGFEVAPGQGLYGSFLEGAMGTNDVSTLELEIVGLYNSYSGVVDYSSPAPFPLNSYTAATNFIYVPDAVLPSDLKVTGSPNLEQYGWQDGVEYVGEKSYSFVLTDSRLEDAFLKENREALAARGYNVFFLESNSQNFWASAEPILRTAVLNTAMFCGVLVIVLALVMFLFLRQRRRDYAISRVLGRPAKKLMRELVAAVCLIGLPAILIGGAAGWLVALDSAAGTLNPFGAVATEFGFALSTSVSIALLPAFMAVVLALLLIFAVAGTARVARLPVLELLQDRASANGKTSKAAKAADTTAAAPAPAEAIKTYTAALTPVIADSAGSTGSAGTSKKAAGRAYLRFMLRHIARAKVKTTLTAITALFFVIALGLLQNAVEHTKTEIERLYDTTMVNVSMVPDKLPNVTRPFKGVISPYAVSGVLESGYAHTAYFEAIHEWSYIVPAAEDGAFPENWKIMIGYRSGDLFSGANYGKINPLLGINDMALFLDHQRWENIDYDSLEEGAQVAFAEGFDASAFVFTENKPIPVLLSEGVMEQYGISPGDTVYINYIFSKLDMGTGGLVTKGNWINMPAVVIGTHNGVFPYLSYPQMQNAVLLPLAAMESMLGDDIGYTTLEGTVDPVYNREILDVRAELYGIARNIYAGRGVRLNLVMNDEELRTVVGSLEQNLSLLQLLYPIAIALSVMIGLGLSLLLLLQNAKNAAILRVTGSPKKWSLLTLSAEQAAVCLIGLILGLCAAALAGWGIGASVILAGLYFAGVLVGAAAGGVIVTNKPPLVLLQVKE